MPCPLRLYFGTMYHGTTIPDLLSKLELSGTKIPLKGTQPPAAPVSQGLGPHLFSAVIPDVIWIKSVVRRSLEIAHPHLMPDRTQEEFRHASEEASFDQVSDYYRHRCERLAGPCRSHS